MSTHSHSILNEIGKERTRQQTREGYMPGGDDLYLYGELPRAAAVYALFAGLPDLDREQATTFGPRLYGTEVIWPWDLEHFKLRDRRYDLIRAGALIVAEIERIDRAANLLARSA